MIRRFTAFFMAFFMMFSIFAVSEEADQSWMTFENRTEALYTEKVKTHTLPVYGGEKVVTEISASLKTGDQTEITFSVPEDALYEIHFTYKNLTQSALPTEMAIAIDGEMSFYEMRRIKLSSLWLDDGIFPTDRYGNEVATTPYSADVYQTSGLSDSSGRTDVPFLFELTKGEHTLAVEVKDGEISITEIILSAPEKALAYEHHAAEGDSLIIIEGENIYSRNESSIRGAGEFNALLTPYSVESRKINHLDGASFDAAGDTVTYKFNVENTGWYYMNVFYRQNVKADFPVFVDVLIDGKMPSGAAGKIPFDYATGFTDVTVKAGEENQAFYLTEGEHTLSLRVNCAILTPVYEMIDRTLSEINGLSLEVVRLSGGMTDKYRDYELLTYIPNLVEILTGWADDCKKMVDYVKAYSSIGSGSAFSNLTLCEDQLRRLAEEPEDLPRRLSELSTGSNSAARMLAQQLQDMAVNDLAIDQICFYQEGACLPERATFLQSAAKSAQRFITSFSAQDYSASSGKKGHLQVWMGRSRQYVELLQNMIDTQFTPETGIKVDLSLMPDANKLVLANAAGNAPDAVIGLQYVVPSYLNIRGALYDLTKFEDFGEVAQRFSSGLFIPYTLGEGIYAMPETVNFWVMFYRSDVLNALSIEVPDNMEEVKMILPELQRRNMNFYFPTAGMSGMKVFPGTLPLILQSGGSIYDDMIGDTTLDSEESLNGFKAMTELFTIYNMPTDVPSPGFYQQFRDGTLPIGIADLATYNLLLNAAPELDGLWNIALFPGLVNGEGEVERWTTGGAETMAILSSTDMPDESWEFLKWWSSDEIQSQFGSLLQSTYGSEYIWPTANTSAFASLPLKSEHKKVIMEQMEWMTEAPWVLGTYMLERELSNAFISVTVDGVEARRAMDTAVKRINRETYRKLEEFGYYKNGEMLKPFVTPDETVVENIIKEYNEKKEAQVNNENQ
ncbi:MAG: extracellular solute-binding protein [Clostridia bacterium]|nr:extracellular solute-binding protein [Clostridia bacterium]